MITLNNQYCGRDKTAHYSYICSEVISIFTVKEGVKHSNRDPETTIILSIRQINFYFYVTENGNLSIYIV